MILLVKVRGWCYDALDGIFGWMFEISSFLALVSLYHPIALFFVNESRSSFGLLCNQCCDSVSSTRAVQECFT